MSTKDSSTRTRSEILDAAWELMMSRGAEVSMKDVAAAAGVSRQSVYVHFQTRAGLLVALVRRADERLQIREAFDEARVHAEPAQRLDATLTAWFDFVKKIQPVAADLIRLRQVDTDAAAWEDRMMDLRAWLHALTRSIEADGALAPGWTSKDASEHLWAATSVQVYTVMTRDLNWSHAKVSKVLRRSAAATLLQASPLVHVAT